MKKKSECELVVDLILKAFLNVWQRPTLSHTSSGVLSKQGPLGRALVFVFHTLVQVGVSRGSLAEDRAHAVAGFMWETT